MRFYPINVIRFVVVVLLIATYGLAFLGFSFAEPRLYAWAKRICIATLAVSLTPLLTFLVGEVVDRVRGDHAS